MSQSTTKTTRRAFLQATASLGAIVSVPMAFSDPEPVLSNPEQRAQAAYIEAVVHKNLGRAREVPSQKIRLFALRFTEHYGVVDYKKMYGGIVGEYRLSRLFARSLYTPTA